MRYDFTLIEDVQNAEIENNIYLLTADGPQVPVRNTGLETHHRRAGRGEINLPLSLLLQHRCRCLARLVTIG